MTPDETYLILLRRELTRAQARLRRAERERDRALEALRQLEEKVSSRRRKRRAEHH